MQFQDNATKVAGRHTIKFGYSFTDVILTNYFIQRVRGEYEYSTLQQYLYDLTPDVLGERSAGPTAYPDRLPGKRRFRERRFPRPAEPDPESRPAL